MNFSISTSRQQVEYFTTVLWGKHYEDDKYFETELLEDHFIIFYTYVFARLELPRPTRAQYEMALFVMDRSNSHRMVITMRALAKSLTSQIYVVWRFLRNPDEKILIMSSGRTRAGNYSQFVQKLIKTLPITKPLSPRHNIERTSGVSFDVAGARPSDSPSMYAVGAKTQVTGFRATFIIYDDVETAQSVESSVMSETINTYAMEAQNLLMSGCDESLTLCTPHSIQSIYINWIEEKGFVPFIIPALYPENTGTYFNGLAPYIIKRMEDDPTLVGQAIDERIDRNYLESKKQRIGRSKFKLQYMLDVSESDEMRYPLRLSDLIVDDVDDEVAPLRISYSSMPENLLYQKHNGFSKDRMFKPAHRSEEMGQYDWRIMFVDTAGRGQDEVGIAVAYHMNTRIFFKKITGLSGGYEDDNMTNIATLAKIHKLHAIVTEDNFGDGAFAKLLESHVARISPETEIVGLKVTGQKEVRIIEALEPIMNQHRIVVDKQTLSDDFEIADRQYSFTHQLTHVTRERGSLRHDDRLDAVAGAVIFLLDKISDDEARGMTLHREDEAQKTLEFTMSHFGIRPGRGNFISHF